MSKNSQKAIYTQLMNWLPTVVKNRDKRVKARNVNKRGAVLQNV